MRALSLLYILFILSCKENNYNNSSAKTNGKGSKDSIKSSVSFIDSSEIIYLRHSDTTYINGHQIIANCNSDYFFYILNGEGDTLFKEFDLFPDFEFSDFNKDGFADVRIYYITNVPNVKDLILYDAKSGYFRIVEDFTNFPSPESITGTNYYYSYHRSGCADYNWDSDLFYIHNFKATRLGNISGIGCEYDNIVNKAIYINKVEENKPIPIDTLSIELINDYKDYKWGFIKSYWKKNHRTFVK